MTMLKRVLVVDDDPVVGKSFERVLSPKGYAVIHAASGAEALERLANEKYDMVYTDMRMPGIDGLEVARRIKAQRPWLPVVIVTGYGSEASEAEAFRIGAAEFLRKPLSPEMIDVSSQLAFTSVALPAPEAPEAPQAPAKRNIAKDVALFVAAPFIGLAYVALFPFIGLGLLGKAAWDAFRAKR